jgi:hypothetical protein
VAARRGVGFAEQRGGKDPDDRLVIDDQADGHAPEREPVREVRRPVDRVQRPQNRRVARGRVAVLLAKDRVAGVTRGDGVPQELLDCAVDVGDHRAVGLRVDRDARLDHPRRPGGRLGDHFPGELQRLRHVHRTASRRRIMGIMLFPPPHAATARAAVPPRTDLLVTTSLTPAPALEERARMFAAELSVPFVPRRDEGLPRLFAAHPDASRALLVQTHRLLLAARDGKAELFYHPNMAFLRLGNLLRGGRDLLIEAGRIGSGDRVLDATLGYASEAILCATSPARPARSTVSRRSPNSASSFAKGCRP